MVCLQPLEQIGLIVEVTWVDLYPRRSYASLMRDHRPNIARTGAKVQELLRVELDALVCQVADAVLINDAHRLLRALWPQHRIHSRCGLPGPVQQGQVWVLVVALV